MQYLLNAPASLYATVQLPASKSISNRALILHALSGGSTRPENLSDCDDTQVMIRALDHMPDVIDIHAAGTAMRFLTAYLCVTPGTHTITGNLVKEGDTVMLVMPQDSQAPKGRLILPQVQTIRELLDRRCTVVGCTPDRIRVTLQALSSPPQLIITDSQAFSEAWSAKPEESRLTSFSILFAGYKGDISAFMDGTGALDRLTEDSRILIAEACTHAPATEDIGRVKIPRMLRQRIGQGLRIDIVSGTDFPEDLSGYDLIIHCGACMFNRRYVLNRIASARSRHIPITNYGLTIAWAKGILGKVALPPQER